MEGHTLNRGGSRVIGTAGKEVADPADVEGRHLAHVGIVQGEEATHYLDTLEHVRLHGCIWGLGGQGAGRLFLQHAPYLASVDAMRVVG